MKLVPCHQDLDLDMEGNSKGEMSNEVRLDREGFKSFLGVKAWAHEKLRIMR